MLEKAVEYVQQSDVSGNRCPYSAIGQEFNPLVEPQLSHPYPFFARARKEEPVFFSSLLNMWVVTRYDDVKAILKDPECFSSSGAVEAAVRYTPEVRDILRTGIPFASLQRGEADPTEHMRVRSSVNKAFTPRRVASLKPRVYQFGNQLIDQFAADGQADLVKQFSSPHPLMVIFSMMGVPEEAMGEARGWVKSFLQLFFGNASPEQQVEYAHNVVAFQRYLCTIIEQRRHDPQEDLISDLVQSVDTGRTGIFLPEMIQILCGLVIAGLDTTTNLLSSCLFQLLTERKYWQAIQAHPELIPTIVEESLRFDGPSRGVFRTATRDVVVGGVTIPGGAKIYGQLNSSNHDEEHFNQPELFDPYRENVNQHIAFGYGPRFCLGAPLVRLEATVSLELLCTRLPSLRLVPDQAKIYTPNLVLRDLQQLLVEWDV